MPIHRLKLNRRSFLKWLPPSFASLALPAASAQAESSAATAQVAPDTELDVAIIGAGVAGCYVAYRLTQATEADFHPDSPLLPILRRKGSLDVGLFEYSGRVGGRLLSAELPGIGDGPRKYAEFGGFRFQEQMHIVRDLATHLGLEHEPFPVDEPPENFVHLRGKRLRRCQLSEPAVLPYTFTSAETKLLARGGDFSTFVANQAFAKVLKDFDDPGNTVYTVPNGYISLRTAYHEAFQAEEWVKVKALRETYESAKLAATVDGRNLRDWSWWNLLTRYLSQEAINFSEDSGGYNSLWSPGNVSSDLREDFYFAEPSDIYPKIYGQGGSGPTPEQACNLTAWKHIITGYSDIPNRMYDRFLQAGGQSFLNHQLLSFDRAPDGGYDLRFFRRESGTLGPGTGSAQVAADPRGGATGRAKFLVLTLPKRSLRLLEPNNFFLRNPTVNDLLDSALNNPAIRMFMAYEHPWWLDAPGTPDLSPDCQRYDVPPTCGRSTTDLNVRQFYYWHTEEGQPSFVLATYSNAEAEHYWRTLQQGKGFDSLRGTQPGRDRHDGAQGRGPRAASREMARMAHEQLKRVVGVEDAPEPYYAHFQNWTKDPWGAGWHAFRSGYSDNEIIPQILQPLAAEQVYICGECYSNVQGWVQGALNTSEVLLQKKLGLAYPTWLQPGGTWLGPGSEGIPTI